MLDLSHFALFNLWFALCVAEEALNWSLRAEGVEGHSVTDFLPLDYDAR